MKSLRHLYALLVVAALMAGLTVIPSAQAKRPGKSVTDVFAVTYDLTTTYKHHRSASTFVDDDELEYRLHGRMPELTFVDGLLQVDRSVAVKANPKGSAGAEVKQFDGWWMSCSGDVLRVRGLVGIARLGDRISFLPALAAFPAGVCKDSEGKTGPFTFAASWPGKGLLGAKLFPVSAASIDVPRWSKPFRIAFEDEKCPNYEPEVSISCSYVVKGTLTLTRVDREEG